MTTTGKLILLAAAVLSGAGSITAETPLKRAAARNVMPAGSHETFAGVKKTAAPARSASVHADFSVKGTGSSAATWSENFNGGTLPTGWSADKTDYVNWTVKLIAADGDRSFSRIDPDDTGSLFVEGPYQTFRREISRAVSAPVEIGSNATLHAYIGFSLNYDDECRLSIEVSADGFENDITLLWNSGNETGERPWMWRPVSADLSAYAGKTVRFRFTYGPGGKDNFQTGGYLGDFAIDGLEVRSSVSVDKIDVETGEEITFVDLTPDAEAAAWQWSFPGATPEASTERNPTVFYTTDGTYDVSLTVTDGNGESTTVTKTGFVNVKGTAPEARIGLPASFRLSTTRLPLIAPMAPVKYTDASTGFPTEHQWEFTGVDSEPGVITTVSGATAEVGYAYLHQQSVALTASNMHGTSSATADVSVEYDGVITNFRPDDRATVFDLEGRGEFPGTNTMKITAYAEKFSKPSRPIVVQGAYVYFTRAEAEEVVDQIANVGVHLYTSENGLPGKRLDSMWWSVFELDLPSGDNLVGTAFPFTEAPVVDDEFFIVVDGIPEKNETCTVSFAMADFRGEGNTAYMLKDGEWVDVSTYFPAGKNHTSYLIQPAVIHSVISNLPMGANPEVKFDEHGGNATYDIFSYMGYETPVASSDDWVRVVSTPNGMTVDALTIQADALPAGTESRRATLTLTDGAGTFEIPVFQERNSGIEAPATTTAVNPTVFSDEFTVSAAAGSDITVFDMQGRCLHRSTMPAGGSTTIDGSSWAGGVYIVRTGTDAPVKAVKK